MNVTGRFFDYICKVMNSFGRKFRVEVFGESHGPAVGAVIDGVAAGIPLDVADFASDTARRAPSAEGTTARREDDVPEILSGVRDGFTTGTPIAILFRNSDVRSGDYSTFTDTPRPGHADYAAIARWGDYADIRGGGHFSGRLTLPLVAAGVVAKKSLALRSRISICAEVAELGGSADSCQWNGLIQSAMADGDSLGGIVSCRVSNLPAGIGEPFWDSVESLISHAVFAIPGVRGIEFGDGFKAAAMRASAHNDPLGPDGPVQNGAGGVNGGLTNGAPLCFRVAFKPASSISRPQRTYDFKEKRMTELVVSGRHDCCFVQRTPVIVEAATAIVLADIL